MRTLLITSLLYCTVGCSGESIKDTATTPTTDTSVQGLNSLYMGHSYFRKQAEAMEEYAEIAGISGHQTTSTFYGGANGSAAAIWENVSAFNSRELIQDDLDEGDIECLV